MFLVFFRDKMGNLILSQAVYHHLPTFTNQNHFAEHARRKKHTVYPDSHRNQQSTISFNRCSTETSTWLSC